MAKLMLVTDDWLLDHGIERETVTTLVEEELFLTEDQLEVVCIAVVDYEDRISSIRHLSPLRLYQAIGKLSVDRRYAEKRLTRVNEEMSRE